jgi:RNA polymerase sigma factor (sigma-70 family)
MPVPLSFSPKCCEGRSEARTLRIENINDMQAANMQGTTSRAGLAALHAVFHVGVAGGLSDEQLLDRFRTGEKHDAELAFAVLVQRHGPMVLRVCGGVLGNPHDTADAFQATFLVLARRSGLLGLRGPVGPWLCGVARRISVRAKVAARHRRERELEAAAFTTDWSARGELPAEDISALHEEIALLPEKFRRPVVLCYLEGLSYELAGRRLRLNESTIRGRLARARKALAGRLRRRGLAPAIALLSASGTRRAHAAFATTLFKATAEGAVHVAKGHIVVKGFVADLIDWELRSMFMSRIRFVTAAFLAASTMALCAIGNAQQRAGEPNGPLDSNRELPSAHATAASNGSAATPSREGEGDDSLARLVGGEVIRSAPLAKDCMVLSYLPDWSHGDVDNIGIANNDGGVRTLLKWPEIKDGEATDDRRFVLALFSRKTTAGGSAGSILAFELTTDWRERTSWKTLPECDTEPSASFKFSVGDGWKLLDITPIIKSQAKAGRKSNGVMLRFLSEDRSGAKQNWSGYEFVSREGTGKWANLTPRLLVVKAAKH